MTNCFMVMNLKEKLGVVLMGVEKELPLNWADGMIGAMPVFESEESARKAYPQSKLLKFEIGVTE